jgi:hypothetical protein
MLILFRFNHLKSISAQQRGKGFEYLHRRNISANAHSVASTERHEAIEIVLRSAIEPALGIEFALVISPNFRIVMQNIVDTADVGLVTEARI